MARYVVKNEIGQIVNMVEWDGISPWTPGLDLTMQLAPTQTDIGDSWDGVQFIPQVRPPAVGLDPDFRIALGAVIDTYVAAPSLAKMIPILQALKSLLGVRP